MYPKVTGSLLGLGLMVTALVAHESVADGSEQLASAAIPLAQGSGFAIGGTGLFEYSNSGYTNLPGQIFVAVPADATVEQVLLYWNVEVYHPSHADNEAVVNGVPVVGQSIGGPTHFFSSVNYQSFRADITGLGVVQPGANTVEVSEIDSSYRTTGAGIVVIYDDGTPADLRLDDGLDLAYWNFAGDLNSTAPVTWSIIPTTTDRVAEIPLLVGSVGDARPNVIEVQVGSTVYTYVDLLTSIDGTEWDSQLLEVPVPAGASEVTVQILSEDGNNTGRNPASIAWIAAGLAVREGLGGEGEGEGEEECLPCDGDLTSLTVQYTGTTAATIKVTQKKDKETIFTGDVQAGQEFSFTGGNGAFDKMIDIYVNGKKRAKFHTDCKKLKIGDADREFIITGGSSEAGPLCPPQDLCTRGKPYEMQFIYTGDGCEASSHFRSAPHCTGDPADAELVRIHAYDKHDAEHQNVRVFFDDFVVLGETIKINSRAAGLSRYRGNLYVDIYDNAGNLLQELMIHTACNNLMQHGDQFGALQLVGLLGEKSVQADSIATEAPVIVPKKAVGCGAAGSSTTGLGLAGDLAVLAATMLVLAYAALRRRFEV